MSNSTPQKQKDLSLMISAYNEESCLEEVVEDLLASLNKSGINFELFLVNNGSSDNTQKIIEKLKKAHPKHIRTLKIDVNRKLGGAVNLVMGRYIKGKIIGFTCADGEVLAEDTVNLAKIILENKNLSLVKTIRVRRRDGARIIVSKIYNALVRALFRVRTGDINGWPVLIRYDDFKKMHLRNYSWIFQLEYLYQIRRMGKKFTEIVVYHQNRKGGKSKVKLNDIIIFTRQMFSYRMKTLFSV